MVEIVISEWLPIDKNPPPYNVEILLCNDKVKCVGKLIKTDSSGHHWDLFVTNKSYIGYSKFTHWMKLPLSIYENSEN